MGGENSSHVWLTYVLLTVVTWGLYGVFLHKSALGMGDPVNGRYKAFLMVGIAYFITAVLAPLGMMLLNGSTWSMPSTGVSWGITAGIVGAIGAFGVLLAFAKGGNPGVVMSIIFAGAPIVNAVIAYLMTSAPNTRGITPPFVVGILLAAVGGCLVMLYRPDAPVTAPGAPGASSATVQLPGAAITPGGGTLPAPAAAESAKP